jgi:hypothetical protein
MNLFKKKVFKLNTNLDSEKIDQQETISFI